MHIPGHPTIVVDNRSGAGSLLAANHIFKVAKPDGLTFGQFSGGFTFNQVMGQAGIEFDRRKFVFVGAVARDESAIALTRASGINFALPPGTPNDRADSAKGLAGKR